MVLDLEKQIGWLPDMLSRAPFSLIDDYHGHHLENRRLRKPMIVPIPGEVCSYGAAHVDLAIFADVECATAPLQELVCLGD